jgi:hypothetical protein
MIILYEIAEGDLSRQRQHSFCRSVPFSFRSVYHFVTNSWRRPKQTKTAFILSYKHWWKLFFINTSIHFAVPFRSVDDHFVRNSWRRSKQTKTAFILPLRSVPFSLLWLFQTFLSSQVLFSFNSINQVAIKCTCLGLNNCSQTSHP